MQYKILTAIGGVALLAAGIASIAGAETPGASAMRVNITPSGNASIEGTISSISGTTINVASWGGTWVVDASSARLVRRFGGAASSISEFQNGDAVQVMGTASQSGWAITAKTVRDISIQARNANFSGTVSNVSGSMFTLTTRGRGAVTVNDSSSTIMVNGKSARPGDIVNGLMAKVSGVWDRNQNTVTANRIMARTPRSGREKENASSTER